ncbi:GLPGLI family protein [Chitinophaga terrae (ex Kim and Jung 2007)]|uniref:GLPGLI family protein n=1 Tax=Chitinophaga terrae (ex Kim and Jung 2007) TaxID=408074 RepID=A0A1H4D871_9BACT|nr:GLPGLI family protein [Chitinophaga terrae (ex Kim and Jung 2007)]GEP90510.1 GLPGLI family protein [Chitinophaga terrae (ex Kim and Jung 2007)]SEA68462.1 GLPGLI family protein [Chitinophaga terrae (ex Kim and Jung 2007)]
MRYVLLFLFIFLGTLVFGQSPPLPVEGSIVFERKENSAYFKKKWGTSNTGDQAPDFKSLFFELKFTGTKSVYMPVDSVIKQNGTGGLPGADNIVYTDIENNTTTCMRNVLGTYFLLEKPVAPIKWKLTGETRMIAGFECRRANAIILDSIYVVAFYTDNIVSNLGPETFAGLPGMILGVALPHQHVSWFAQTVNLRNVDETSIRPPVKGNKMTSSGFLTTVKSSLGPLDPYLNEYLYMYLL